MIDEGLRLFLLQYPGVEAEIEARVYPAPLPEGVDLPAVTYTDISDVGSYSFDGPDCLSKVTYQIDHWAETREEARRVERATRQALSGYSGSWQGTAVRGVFRRNTLTLRDPESQLWRAVSDYQINAIGDY